MSGIHLKHPAFGVTKIDQEKAGKTGKNRQETYEQMKERQKLKKLRKFKNRGSVI